MREFVLIRVEFKVDKVKCNAVKVGFFLWLKICRDIFYSFFFEHLSKNPKT